SSEPGLPELPACGSFVVPLKPLPPNAPSWALRLRDCEKIGDSYRGYCSTEAELEAVLLLPAASDPRRLRHEAVALAGPQKPATRLMWKSQYVPYDGIPFVNAVGRSMECQFGPRRKGLQPKKMSEQENSQHYKATCPARIYIKKVWKFPEYRVPTDPKVDKKVVRQEQEKAFFNLKKSLVDVGGVLRYYVQLPTQKAHLYHDMDTPILPPPPLPFPEDTPPVAKEEEEADGEGTEEESTEDGACVPSRLHPRVAEKIQELVAQGHGQVYTVRKQLRRFVEREMFKAEKVPERHNLCYFPTVNDIKNHIHEAQKALQLGGLDTTGPAVDTQVRNAVINGAETLSPDAAQLFSSLASLQPKIFAQLQVGQRHSPAQFHSAPPTPRVHFLPPVSAGRPATAVPVSSRGRSGAPGRLQPPAPRPRRLPAALRRAGRRPGPVGVVHPAGQRVHHGGPDAPDPAGGRAGHPGADSPAFSHR
uniref:Calcium-responsive transcription factor n=1 Tax=Denticeps clupeoides TaxID=299321 RepID=A0AAY4B5W1_9TELE